MSSRSYSKYNATNATVPDLAGIEGLTANFPCVLISIDGYAAGAGWLQVHDVAATSSLSSGSTVPLKSMRVSAAGPLPSFFATLEGVTLHNGLCLALSTTELVYTSGGSAFDVWGEISEFELDNTIGATIAGDTVSGIDELAVWTGSNATEGLHTLRQLLVTGPVGSTNYLMIFAEQQGGDGGKPTIPAIKFTTGQTRRINFGTDGLNVYSKPTSATKRDSCYLNGSSTADVFTATGAGGWKMKAWYV